MRTAFWELKGLFFLNSINSKRYELKRESFLDGTFIEFVLIDNEKNQQIGNRIVQSSISKECWIKF